MLVLLATFLAPGVGAAFAAEPGIGVVAEDTVDGRGRLVVDVDAAPLPPTAFAVTVDGHPQPVSAAPILSDRLSMALVVDASAAGDPALQPGLSGVVDFALATAPTTRATLVTDATPPTVVTPLQPGPSTVLAGLDGIVPRGERQTPAALDLALRQLPREPDTPRLVVLYTAAADAPGQSVDDLVARLKADGAVLAVVTTGGAVPPYWSAAADGSGGVAVGAPESGVVAAFAQVAAALRSRYLVTLPAPDQPSAATVVRVTTPSGTRTAATTVAPAPTSVRPAVVVAAVVLGVVVLVLCGVLLARRRGRPTPSPGPAATQVWNVPARAEPVVDRVPLRAAIEKALRAGRPVVVWPAEGREGLGVTTAMTEVAHRNRGDYDIAWWIAARDPQLVGDQLAQLAEALGLATPADSSAKATAAVLDALRTRGRWLLVFDEAESHRDLAPFVPAGPGHVLVGSAAPDGERDVTPVVAPPFTRAESVALLQARRRGLTTAEADRVAAALDDVPVALDTAGATLAATGMSVDSYLRLLAGPQGSTTAGPSAPAAASAVAVDRLGSDDPTALALLTLVAWLGQEPVPLSLLAGHADRLPASLAQVAHDPAALAERAATLERRALARVEGDGVRLHPLHAADLVRRTADDRPDGAGWAAWAVRLLRAAVPPDLTDPACLARWRRLMPHVLAATDPGRQLDDVAVEVGWLLQRAAGFLTARGERGPGQALLEDSYDLRRRTLGGDHPDTLSAARDLADTLRALGHDDQALRVLDDVRTDAATDR